jgi:hypothetical protein
MAAKRLAKKSIISNKKKNEDERDKIRKGKTENLSLDKYTTERNIHD